MRVCVKREDDATTKKPTASDEASPNKASTPHLEKLGNSVWTITGLHQLQIPTGRRPESDY
eukprot:6283974-Amphidinium_carterae.1